MHNNDYDVTPGQPKKFRDVRQNKIDEDAARDEALNEVKAEYGDGFEVEKEVKYDGLDRTHDGAVIDKASGKTVEYIEVKKGGSRYHSSQKLKDKIIEAKTGVKTRLIRK